MERTFHITVDVPTENLHDITVGELIDQFLSGVGGIGIEVVSISVDDNEVPTSGPYLGEYDDTEAWQEPVYTLCLIDTL